MTKKSVTCDCGKIIPINPDRRFKKGIRNKCRGCLPIKEQLQVERIQRKQAREDTKTARTLRKYALNRAHSRGIPFDLVVEDILVPTHCPVLGIELKVGGQDAAPSLDRIRPALGYVKGNIVVVSALANRIKSNATPEQIKLVAKYYSQF